MPIKVFKQQWVLAVIVTFKGKYKKEKEHMSNLQIKRYFLNPPKNILPICRQNWLILKKVNNRNRILCSNKPHIYSNMGMTDYHQGFPCLQY